MPKLAGAIITDLNLAPHPEGGWYREVHRSALKINGPRGVRAAITSIYYLLERMQSSRWHVVDADEIWHFYEGAPLELFTYDPASRALQRTVLCTPNAGGAGGAGGSDVLAAREGGVPVGVVPAGVWQAARTLGDYSLTGCTVAPGFEFSDFHFVSELPSHAEHFATTLEHLQDLL